MPTLLQLALVRVLSPSLSYSFLTLAIPPGSRPTIIRRRGTLKRLSSDDKEYSYGSQQMTQLALVRVLLLLLSYSFLTLTIPPRSRSIIIRRRGILIWLGRFQDVLEHYTMRYCSPLMRPHTCYSAWTLTSSLSSTLAVPILASFSSHYPS